ncbi:MAG: hypothetical protein WC972_02970 [Trueperaceae bacterium]
MIRPTWERVLLAAALLLLILLLVGAIREQTTGPSCYWQSTLVLDKFVDTLVCP